MKNSQFYSGYFVRKGRKWVIIAKEVFDSLLTVGDFLH